jgi:hypothetical protein
MRGRSRRTSSYAFPNDHTVAANRRFANARAFNLRAFTGTRIFSCLVLVGAAGVGGLAAGFVARPGVANQATSSVIVDMSPSDTVTLRFPADWNEAVDTAAETMPNTLAFASADGSMTLFSPRPIYPIPEVAESTPAESAQAEPAAKPRTIARAAAVPAAPAPAPKITLASASSKPVNVAPKPAHKSNAVLNDSQIASIKKRLALTPDQERYWPAVEAELRKMEYKKGQGGTRTAAVDMSKVDVEGLKSAGFPLVMSFSDDQRRELKSLAHLLGLESAMSGI